MTATPRGTTFWPWRPISWKQPCPERTPTLRPGKPCTSSGARNIPHHLAPFAPHCISAEGAKYPLVQARSKVCWFLPFFKKGYSFLSLKKYRFFWRACIYFDTCRNFRILQNRKRFRRFFVSKFCLVRICVCTRRNYFLKFRIFCKLTKNERIKFNCEIDTTLTWVHPKNWSNKYFSKFYNAVKKKSCFEIITSSQLFKFVGKMWKFSCSHFKCEQEKSIKSAYTYAHMYVTMYVHT